MTKQSLAKIAVYGLLQWIILNVVLFVLSLIFGIRQKTEMTTPPPLGFVLLAVIMVGVSYMFVRRLSPANRSQAVMAGLVWFGMTLLFMLVVTFANGTQANIFGNWGSYAMFLSQVVGAVLVKPKSVNSF